MLVGLAKTVLVQSNRGLEMPGSLSGSLANSTATSQVESCKILMVALYPEISARSTLQATTSIDLPLLVLVASPRRIDFAATAAHLKIRLPGLLLVGVI